MNSQPEPLDFDSLPSISPKPVKSRRIDWFSALLIVVTVIVLGRTAWNRFGPAPWPEPPSIGQNPPMAKLIDLDTDQPLFLFFPRGQVVWLTFWSAQSSQGRDDLKMLESVWRRFRGQQSFRMLAVAIEWDQADAVRTMVREADAALPVFLAPEAARRAYGARSLPFHVLVDAKGKVLMIGQGRSPDEIERLSKAVQAILDRIEPAISPRFAKSSTLASVLAKT